MVSMHDPTIGLQSRPNLNGPKQWIYSRLRLLILHLNLGLLHKLLLFLLLLLLLLNGGGSHLIPHGAATRVKREFVFAGKFRRAEVTVVRFLVGMECLHMPLEFVLPAELEWA